MRACRWGRAFTWLIDLALCHEGAVSGAVMLRAETAEAITTCLGCLWGTEGEEGVMFPVL